MYESVAWPVPDRLMPTQVPVPPSTKNFTGCAAVPGMASTPLMLSSLVALTRTVVPGCTVKVTPAGTSVSLSSSTVPLTVVSLVSVPDSVIVAGGIGSGITTGPGVCTSIMVPASPQPASSSPNSPSGNRIDFFIVAPLKIRVNLVTRGRAKAAGF